ncbi:histidine phosphatase family protein [Thermoflavimicrobium daqui]|jgi:2,3-bisphosphoglycerate-dependent phosphoglycerate mutase|uniref:Histidine phosphatase family protein n=1 Tax=Thermoflavimicrobium daqui TaxID=2137476 RepID=A0A364K104_9BACL|nr:histidine phosphatase family protein [Thermoflavimicrobium daqui]RAL21372.1 histidine phosphatase family protein [Thermoflavimicrobium daqui]
MKHFYVIRHCEAEGQQSDAKLTIKGKKQAIELADFFENIKVDRIISSPYTRAIETIEPLAKMLGLTIIKDERLVERVLCQTALPDWLDWLRASFDHPEMRLSGGETSREAMERVLSVLSDELKQEEQSIVLVSHGNLITLLLHSFDSSYGFASWTNLTNPDIFKLTFDEEKVKIERIWNQ